MASLQMSGTALPDSTPPAIRLDISATGTPTVTSVTIERYNPDGTITPLRGATGNTVVLSGGSAVAYDYEAPFGVDVSYVAHATGAPSFRTLPDRLDLEQAWLVHVGIPAHSVPVEFRVGTNDEESLDVDQGVFPVLGRSTPIVVTGGVRQAPASTLIVGTETHAQAHGMRQLLADGGPLFLNVHPSSQLGLDSCYISVGSVSVRRPSNIGTDPHRDFVLPYRVVTRPAGGARALVTWEQVSEGGRTWADIEADGVTWAELAAPSS